MTLYTIGFTKTTAERFFERLRVAGVKTLVDTRLNRAGQLSGFAKMPDLEYFVTSLTSAAYRFEPLLAPDEEMLASFKAKQIDWAEYERRYVDLIRTRDVERAFSPETLDRACLLCSEDRPERCHRRLAAEYLKDAFQQEVAIEIVHL